MKTTVNLFLSLTLVICFVSCQREPTETIPELTTSDSIINRLIVLDTSLAAGADTSTVINFTYDASGRISIISATYYNAGVVGPGRIHSVDDIVYQYSGTSLMPSTVHEIYTGINPAIPADKDTIYLSYTGGYLSYDSIDYGGNYSVTSFEKLGTTRYRMKQRHLSAIPPPPEYIDTSYIYVNWVNGNLLKEIDSLWVHAPVPGFWEVETTTVLYDNKPNPFKDISVVPYPAPLHTDIPAFGAREFVLPTTNNIISVNDDTGIYLLTYEYGPTGLPRIARTNEGTKLIYQYNAR